MENRTQAQGKQFPLTRLDKLDFSLGLQSENFLHNGHEKERAPL